MQAQEHARELYKRVPSQLLSWQHRMPRLVHELAAYEAHICCLQEVDHPEQLQPEMARLGCSPSGLQACACCSQPIDQLAPDLMHHDTCKAQAQVSAADASSITVLTRTGHASVVQVRFALCSKNGH